MARHLYLATVGLGIKAGCSIDVPRRMRELRACLAKAYENTGYLEPRVHQELSAYRVFADGAGREVFDCDLAIVCAAVERAIARDLNDQEVADHHEERSNGGVSSARTDSTAEPNSTVEPSTADGAGSRGDARITSVNSASVASVFRATASAASNAEARAKASCKAGPQGKKLNAGAVNLAAFFTGALALVAAVAYAAAGAACEDDAAGCAPGSP